AAGRPISAGPPCACATDDAMGADAISDQVALVTGGGRGIGAAVARELAGGGMRVAVAARTGHQVEAVARDIGGLALQVDVSDEESVERMVGATESELGPIDLLVNNAGVSGPPSGPMA